MRDFKQLKVWQKAHRLVLDVYRHTRDFPKEERYGLTAHLLKSVTSIPSNIAEGCGRGGKRTMLLGGAKNYLVAMEDVQPDIFIDNFIHSCYGSAGQRCLAGSIVGLVPEIYDAMIEKMIEASNKLVVGDAMDPDVYMGPVISAAAKNKIENYIDIGIEGGSKLVLDGRSPKVREKNKNGYF